MAFRINFNLIDPLNRGFALRDPNGLADQFEAYPAMLVNALVTRFPIDK